MCHLSVLPRGWQAAATQTNIGNACHLARQWLHFEHASSLMQLQAQTPEHQSMPDAEEAKSSKSSAQATIAHSFRQATTSADHYGDYIVPSNLRR